MLGCGTMGLSVVMYLQICVEINIFRDFIMYLN